MRELEYSGTHYHEHRLLKVMSEYGFWATPSVESPTSETPNYEKYIKGNPRVNLQQLNSS